MEKNNKNNRSLNDEDANMKRLQRTRGSEIITNNPKEPMQNKDTMNDISALQEYITSLTKYKYSSALKYEAESYMIEAFKKGTTTTLGMNNTGENSLYHTPLLMNMAMHIITDSIWNQQQPGLQIIDAEDQEDADDGSDDSDR